MGQYTTVPLSHEQYTALSNAMKTGGAGFRKNLKIMEALRAEAVLGIRITDVVALTPASFVYAAGKHKINIIEKKTKKRCYRTVSEEYYQSLKSYWESKGIKNKERIFPVSERRVQQYLETVCNYLGYENISTHSYRKYCGTTLYNKSGHNIILVMKFFNHSSPEITRRYIGVNSEEMEDILVGHVV